MKSNIQNYHVVVRASSFVLAVFVLALYVCVPAFGYTDISTNGADFSDQPIPFATGTTQNSTSNGSAVIAAGFLGWNYNNYDWYIATVVNDVPAYAFFVDNSTSYTLYACSESSSLVFNFAYGSNNASWPGSYSYDSNSALTYGSRSSSINKNATLNSDIPVFSSLADGLAAVRDWIDNPPAGPSDPHSLSLSLPAGNAIFIEVDGVSSFNMRLTQTTEVGQPQTFYNNQYYGYAESLPLSFSGNPSGSTTITWNGTGNKTLFNRYTSFYYSLYNATNTHKYVFIVNPYATLDEYNQSFNSTINISIDNATGYQYYELTGGIATDGTIGQQTNGTTASGHYNPDTGQWETTNNQTGEPWTPQEGGGNLVTTNSINDWLKTIATQISNFFQGAIGAVTTLVSAGSDFIHSLSGLYAWLPAPVYSVLVSALILIITIGVIKVFI